MNLVTLNRHIVRSTLPSISTLSSFAYNPHFLSKRNFKGTEWTKEQRAKADFQIQQRGQPMDFGNPLTWIGLIAPMFGFAYSFYMINKIYIEKTEEEEKKEKEVIHAITHRDPKLRVDDL